MEFVKCVYCETPLPTRGFFCPSCFKQVKCKHCGEILELSAQICVMCGEEIGSKNGLPTMNTIEFSETKAGRNFKASFTDTVGSNISETFGLFLANKVAGKSSKTTLTPSEEYADVDYQDEVETKTLPETTDKHSVKGIFRIDGDKTVLTETRLKATSKLDYGKRLTCLFLLFKKSQGFEKIPRSELTTMLKMASVEDGNLREWISKNNLLLSKNNFVELLLPGEERAKKILTEVFDSNIPDKWEMGSVSKAGRKPKGKNGNKESDNQKA